LKEKLVKKVFDNAYSMFPSELSSGDFRLKAIKMISILLGY